MAEDIDIAGGMSGRYASALFDLAHQQNLNDAVQADLDRFIAMLHSSEDLQRFVKSPVFSSTEQIKALTALLDKAGIGGLTGNFFKLLAQKRRLSAIEAIVANYRSLNDLQKGISRAEVTVAQPLNDSQLNALKNELTAVVSSRSVDVSVKVDPSILGGMIVRLGSRMLDNSLKTKLTTLRTRMKEVG